MLDCASTFAMKINRAQLSHLYCLTHPIYVCKLNSNLISIFSNRWFPSERYKSHPERRYMASTIFGAKRFGYEKVIKTTMGNMRVAVYIPNKWYVCAAIQNKI